jgi:hypothetical protein
VHPLEAPLCGFVGRLKRVEQRFSLLLVLLEVGAIGKRIGASHADASNRARWQVFTESPLGPLAVLSRAGGNALKIRSRAVETIVADLRREVLADGGSGYRGVGVQVYGEIGRIDRAAATKVA